MADTDTTARSLSRRAGRQSEPVHIGAIMADVCAAIQARRKEAAARLCFVQRKAPSVKRIRLAG